MNKNLSAVSVLSTLILSNISFVEAQSTAKNLQVGLGLSGYWDHIIKTTLNFTGCSSNSKGTIVCSFIINSNESVDKRILINRERLFNVVTSDGTRYAPDKISISSFNNGKETDGDIDTTVSPGINYSLQIKFENMPPSLNMLKYLDIGHKDDKWVRLEDVAIRGTPTPVSSLPTPQAIANPKQYLTANATSGYATLSGVALNGGMYDVTLQGCRVTNPGMAACTLSLAPMRATAQSATLENLNVAVNGAVVAATATATPAVTTLTITAPVNVNRIDELRLGNARFVNVAVR